MLKKPQSAIILILVLLFSLVKIETVGSFGSSCNISITPTNISPNSSGTLSFTIDYNGLPESDIVWVRFTSPSANISITGGASSGWSPSVSGNSITFSSGALGRGGSKIYEVYLNTSSSLQGSWTVQVSTNADGSDSGNCDGDTTFAVSDSGPDTTPPSITSDVTLTAGDATSMTISWTTDESATSKVYYGPTDSYGSSVSGSATTSHSITLSSLTSGATYHYYIEITDLVGNTTSFDDSVFGVLTGTVKTVTNTVTNTVTVNKTIIKEIRDEIKPLAKFSLDFKKIYSTAPEITGTATDEGGVAYVLYSIDDGKNYIPAQIVEKIGSKSVTFKFTPEVRDDGNYKTRVKTVDSSGNESITDLNELVIDRLPPKPVGVLFSVGPLLLQNDIYGYTKVMVGSPVKITLSAIGGPTALEIVTGAKNFPLTKNIESGLWSGSIIFDKVGEINLIARGIDGANNETLTLVGKVNVVDTGFVDPNSELSIYVYDPIRSQFVLWNGSTYEISNPQKVSQDGRYRVLLPSGKYYIEVKKLGFKPLRTAIFEISEERYINSKLSLERKKYFWDIFSTQVNLDEEQESVPTIPAESISGKYLPDFSIDKLNNNSLMGKPSLLSIVSTWMPDTSEQINELQKVQDNLKNSAIYIVAEQETESGLSVFKKLGGYDLNFYADPDGEMYTTFNLFALPTHIFLDRQGMVKTIVSGFLPSDEIVKNLLD